MTFYWCFVDNTRGSKGKVIAKGDNPEKITEELIKMSQRKAFSFYDYRINRREDGSASIFQARYGFDETCKRGGWKRMTSNYIHIPYLHEDVISFLSEIFSKK